MKPDTYAEPQRPMDWQDRVVLKACIFTAMAFALFVAIHWID